MLRQTASLCRVHDPTLLPELWSALQALSHVAIQSAALDSSLPFNRQDSHHHTSTSTSPSSSPSPPEIHPLHRTASITYLPPHPPAPTHAPHHASRQPLHLHVHPHHPRPFTSIAAAALQTPTEHPTAPTPTATTPTLPHLKPPAPPTPPSIPPPTYEELQENEKLRLAGKIPPTLDPTSKAIVVRILRAFCTSGAAKDHARGAHINEELFPRVASAFRKFVQCAITPELRDIMVGWGGLAQPLQELLSSYLVQHARHHFAAELAHHRVLVASSDMRQPHTWYPFARALQRKIIYHAGPTNSGKTYNALEALKAAESGVYCGPLRLLAMEVCDRLNAEGIWCNLVTGQERSLLPGARHMACTTEMADVNAHVDVAVIDEIQLIGCRTRGYAWTRALLGLPANEIHICGDMSALALVGDICQEAGEELEVRKYSRFTELDVEGGSVDAGQWDWVRPGDCIVAFRRSRLYEIKEQIEKTTRHRVCIVYGSLPPETRRQQALLFNDPDSGYDVLVASDAVGMGLNLNIHRILFDAVHKNIGNRSHPVSVSEIKQIAGRAGRRNSAYSQGYVSCLRPRDLVAIRRAVHTPPEDLRTPAAGLLPEWDQLELLAAQLPGASFTSLLHSFAATAQMDGHYFFCNHDELLLTARLLDRVAGLSLKDRYTFCLAPASMQLMEVQLALLQFAYSYAGGHPVSLEMPLPDKPPRNANQMRTLEVNHKILSLWLWLSYRFDDGAFPGRERVIEVLRQIAEHLNVGLHIMTARASGDTAGGPRASDYAAAASPGKAAVKGLPQLPVVYDPHQWVQGFLDRDALLDPDVRKYVKRTAL